MILGRYMTVTTDIDGAQTQVAFSKSCNLSVSQEFIQACSPVGGRTKKKIPTSYDWSVKCDCLLVNSEQSHKFINALKEGKELTLQFILGGFKQKGKAFIKSIEFTGNIGSLSSYSVAFEGSDALEDAAGMDLINGMLYSYSNFADGTLITQGTVEDGTLTDTNQ